MAIFYAALAATISQTKMANGYVKTHVAITTRTIQVMTIAVRILRTETKG